MEEETGMIFIPNFWRRQKNMWMKKQFHKSANSLHAIIQTYSGSTHRKNYRSPKTSAFSKPYVKQIPMMLSMDAWCDVLLPIVVTINTRLIVLQHSIRCRAIGKHCPPHMNPTPIQNS